MSKDTTFLGSGVGGWVEAPTLRWLTRRVIINDDYLIPIAKETRVLQQAVACSEPPGHMWVDVPEVTEET